MDLPANFGKTLVIVPNLVFDMFLTYGGAYAPLVSEDTEALVRGSHRTKYGVVGSTLGIATMVALGAVGSYAFIKTFG